jgi:hypothetical protein
MAVIGKRKCKVYGTVSGNSPRIMRFIEGSGETFKSGALLYLTASQTVRVFMTDASTVAWTAIHKRIVGIAAKDASNHTLQATANEAEKMPVFVGNDDTIFISNCVSRTSAASATLQYTDRGAAFCCSVNSSRVYADRASSATSSMAVIVDLIDAQGDQYGRVLWQVKAAYRAMEF